MKLRPEVLAFAEAMEAQLRANDHKSGWKNDSPLRLYERLQEEVGELRETLPWMSPAGWQFNSPPPNILKEAADVANFAMMVADVTGGLQVEKSRPTGGCCQKCGIPVFEDNRRLCHRCEENQGG